jgi:hypothetical protein
MGFQEDFKDAINKKEISMWRRLIIRSAMLILLTAIAALGMDALVVLGRSGFADFNQRWPEVINILRAGFIMTWAELSLLWLRTAIAPKVDVQAAMLKAAETSTGAAVVSLVHLMQWALRLVVFLELSGLAK